MPLNSANGSPVVSFQDVSFSYGNVRVLDNVSLQIEPGDFLAIVGPNGGGKTTLIKLTLGLERPQHGTVALFGQDVQQFEGWWQIGYVPQSASAFSVRFPATVGEVVSLGGYKKFDPLAIFRRGLSLEVQEALHTVGMWDLRGRLIGELSLGQLQRVLIARALVRKPRLLILDEPTSGVDVVGQEQLYSLLRQINQERGVTVVLISHDVGVVLHEAKKVACINRTLMFHGHARDVTDADLSRAYGFEVDLVIHRHD